MVYYALWLTVLATNVPEVLTWWARSGSLWGWGMGMIMTRTATSDTMQTVAVVANIRILHVCYAIL